MRDESPPIVLVLPRFTRWMKIASIYVGVVWLVQAVLGTLAPSIALLPLEWTVFSVERVVRHLELWRVLTYPLLELPNAVFAPLMTILALWWLGSPIERAGGPKRLLQLALAGTLGGAALALAVGLVVPSFRLQPVLGLSPVTSAFLAAWGFLYAEQPLSIATSRPIKGKHLALALAGFNVLSVLFAPSATGVASIGGLLAGAGWMWMLSRGRNKRGERPSGGGEKRTSGTKATRFRVLSGGRDDGDRKMWN